MAKVFLSLPMNGKSDEWIETEKAKMMRNYDAITGGCNEYVDTYCVMPVETFLDIQENETAVRIWYLAESLKKMSLCDIALFHPDYASARGCHVESFTAYRYHIEAYYLSGHVLWRCIRECSDIRSKRKDRLDDILRDLGIWSRPFLASLTDEHIDAFKTIKGIGDVTCHEIKVLRDYIRKELENGKKNEDLL